jgi:hypothetical protein
VVTGSRHARSSTTNLHQAVFRVAFNSFLRSPWYLHINTAANNESGLVWTQRYPFPGNGRPQPDFPGHSGRKPSHSRGKCASPFGSKGEVDEFRLKRASLFVSLTRSPASGLLPFSLASMVHPYVSINRCMDACASSQLVTTTTGDENANPSLLDTRVLQNLG